MEAWIEKLGSRYGLSQPDVELLEQLGEVKRLLPGQLVVRKGEVNDCIFILRSGVWREYCFREGEEATIWFSVAGEITFSVWGYVGQQPSQLYIESVTESEVCVSRVPAWLNGSRPRSPWLTWDVRLWSTLPCITSAGTCSCGDKVP